MTGWNVALTVESMFHLNTRTAPIALILVVGAITPTAAEAARRPATTRMPPRVLSEPGFTRMSAAEQLRAIADQTGGGHLAILGNKRYVRYADGSLAAL